MFTFVLAMAAGINIQLLESDCFDVRQAATQALSSMPLSPLTCACACCGSPEVKFRCKASLPKPDYAAIAKRVRPRNHPWWPMIYEVDGLNSDVTSVYFTMVIELGAKVDAKGTAKRKATELMAQSMALGGIPEKVICDLLDKMAERERTARPNENYPSTWKGFP